MSIDTLENSSQSHEPASLKSTQHPTLRDSVEKAMENYFSQLGGEDVKDVYHMVLSEVEAPLLEAVMAFTRNNQTHASEVLGLNRGTLRKKLKQYGLL
ncbi:DNA-binding transcriptional regulator Fis [Gynuella sunshinyii]|uniref:Putative Fis-like DNA-binding protein n=1 Tax=Gynuella sunshinyii YC6258 TaxID=1445510 RepID=A0A0C5VIA9_9GAMM|nr:DNA-binding transcriptional regulator Fis [Gynuella sunshinyii]AJQ94402.1 factor for inversion stimulation Fis, transcriptional activator [Gynuella sunshinyii YC6258]